MFDVFWSKTRGYKRSCSWRRCPKHWYLQHVGFSSQYLMEQDTRSSAFMPLAKCPNHWHLQRFCLAVHISASLYNISTRTPCTVLSPEDSVQKASTLKIELRRRRKQRCARCSCARDHESLAAVVILRIDKTRPANMTSTNLEFSTFSGIQLQNGTHKTRRATMDGDSGLTP